MSIGGLLGILAMMIIVAFIFSSAISILLFLFSLCGAIISIPSTIRRGNESLKELQPYDLSISNTYKASSSSSNDHIMKKDNLDCDFRSRSRDDWEPTPLEPSFMEVFTSFFK